MRILIQRLNDSHYLAANGTWVPEWKEGQPFKNPLAALSFCQQQKLDGVQILLKFDDDLYDVNLSLAAARELDSSQIRRLTGVDTLGDQC